MADGQNDLSAAICAYLGYHATPSPVADWGAVVTALGAKAAAIELPLLSVLAETRGQAPDWQGFSLYAGSEWAVRQVRVAHPEIDDRAAKALVWMFAAEHG